MKLRFLFYLFLIGCCFIGCNKEEITETSVSTETLPINEGMILLGEKLENPYSLQNMTKAYESLSENGGLKSSDKGKDIKPTHLYVRFLPTNREELEMLWAEKKLEFFDYPLDYELKGEGSYYRDPSIPEGKPGWMYTVVPVGFNFPTVKYELIEECVIPTEENKNLKSTSDNELLMQLELESLRMTGNLKNDDGLKSVMADSYPKGYIKVKNTSTVSMEGVQGVKVRVRSWVKVDAQYTDSLGFYKMKESFSSTDVHYDLVFENKTGFKIWGNFAFTSPAVHYMREHPKEGYSVDIDNSSLAWLWSTINNGAYVYRTVMCPTYGVSLPPSELRIWALRDDSPSWKGSAPMAHQISLSVSSLLDFILAYGAIQGTAYISLVLPDIFILPDFTDTKETYATLFHELSHASHYTKVGKPYWLSYIDGIVGNSALGKGTYGNGTGNLDGFIGVGEMWGSYFGNYVCCKKYFGSESGWFPTSYWFKPVILKNLQNYNIGPQQVFSCYTSDVTNHEKLKNKIISNYGKEKEVKGVFGAYGF